MKAVAYTTFALMMFAGLPLQAQDATPIRHETFAERYIAALAAPGSKTPSMIVAQAGADCKTTSECAAAAGTCCCHVTEANICLEKADCESSGAACVP